MDHLEDVAAAELAKQRGLHPIAGEAGRYARPTEGGGIVFESSDLTRLVESLDALHEEPELRFALESLVKVATYIDQLGSKTSAIQLLEVAATAAPALQRQNAEQRVFTVDRAEARQSRLAEFTDRPRARSAPTADQLRTRTHESRQSLFGLKLR